MSVIQKIISYHQYFSRDVQIGKLRIGGKNPIPVQSMTNTNTLDTKATVEQVIRLADTGCDIVRIATPTIKEAENLKKIKSTLIEKGYDLPIVADVHFNSKVAEVAAKYVEKVRINPGNYVDRNRGKVEWSPEEIKDAQKHIADRLIPLLEICKKHNTAIRIGTNHGSLSERVLSMYGNTARGMVESTLEFVRICHHFGFDNLVLSIKASRVKDMVDANLLLVEEMLKEGIYYPIHLGVTEAGNGDEARIKSAAGIGSLLARGIGDTIRVSLAEEPVNEVPVGKKLVNNFGRKPGAVNQIISSIQFIKIESNQSFNQLTGVNNPVVSSEFIKEADLYFKEELGLSFHENEFENFEFDSVSHEKIENNETHNLILNKNYSEDDFEDFMLKSAVDFSVLFSVFKLAGIWIDNETFSAEAIIDLSLKILQGLGKRFTNAEFIACPSCGRTNFDLFESFNKVKEKTAHLKGLQIAVMGCIVNGPGEMGDADYGYVGAVPGKVTIYKNGEPKLKNVDEREAVEVLIKLMKEGGDWIDK